MMMLSWTWYRARLSGAMFISGVQCRWGERAQRGAHRRAGTLHLNHRVLTLKPQESRLSSVQPRPRTTTVPAGRPAGATMHERGGPNLLHRPTSAGRPLNCTCTCARELFAGRSGLTFGRVARLPRDSGDARRPVKHTPPFFIGTTTYACSRLSSPLPDRSCRAPSLRAQHQACCHYTMPPGHGALPIQ